MITILKKLRCCCINLYRTDAVRYGMMTMMLFGLLSMAQPAAAQSDNNACIKEATGLNNPACTANDVRIGSFRVVAGPTNCDPTSNDPIQITLEATIESGPARYDIGIWINTAGNSARTDPSGDGLNCYRDFLSPVGTSTVCDQVAQPGDTDGPYYNADLDGCGDVYASGTDPCGNAVTGPCTGGGGGTCLFTTRTFTVEILCRDSNSDGIADVGSCTSWDQGTRSFCADELGTNPGTGSKCNCSPINIIGLHTGCVTAADCADDNDACTTNTCTLSQNNTVGTCTYPAITCADDNNACTTGSCDPTLGCVNTPITCDDGDACNGVETCAPASGCVAGTAPDCEDNNACTDDSCIPASGCVNTNSAAGTLCGDGTDTVCDNPDTCDGSGGCTNDNNEPTTVVCRQEDGACDVAENCDGSGNCPTDVFDVAPTVTLALNLACEDQGEATATQLVATVSPSGSYSYSWTGPDGAIATTGSAITPTKPGTYTVLVTDLATNCPTDEAFELCFTGQQVQSASVVPTQQLQATASFTVPARSQPTGFRAFLGRAFSIFD